MVKVESTGDGNYQLTAGYAFDTRTGAASTPPVNSHELENNMSQVDVWTNPVLFSKLVAAFGCVAGANGALVYLKGEVDNFNQNTKRDETAVEAAEEVIGTVYSAPQLSLILNIFRGLAYHQVKNSIQFDSVYRRRITAASYNQVQAAFTGAGQIWTTAEILAFESVPSAWWFQLPSTYLWLKAKPVVVTVMQQKTEISYSYLAVAEAWDCLYTAYGAATLLSF